MTTMEMRKRLLRLDKEANQLRENLRFGAPNKLLYRSFTSVPDSRMVVVEADGNGGAWTSMVEGGFPLDYQIHYERHFETEIEALRVGEDVVQLRADPEIVLQPAAALPSRLRYAKAAQVGA